MDDFKRALNSVKDTFSEDYRVIKRTAKTATILTGRVQGGSVIKQCKIRINDDGEFIYPDGRHSMCSVFRA